MWILLLILLSSCDASFLYKECHPSFYNRPSCINEPAGYYCSCGPGFKWNSRSCIAAGVDSKMIFSSMNTSYTLLKRQFMPPNFTISLWIRPKTGGVLLSMVQEEGSLENTSLMMLSLDEDYEARWTAVLEYLGTKWIVRNAINTNQWSHIIWTQKIINKNVVKWVFYLNGEYQENNVYTAATTLRGLLILGQFNTTSKTRVGNVGFSGDVAHVNIWNTNIAASLMQEINRDCLYNYCGNVVEWANFRYGTNGNLLLKWPSGIKVQPCVNASVFDRSCDLACSLWNGAQCKMEITYNSQWSRVKANTTDSVTCPMPKDPFIVIENQTVVIDRRPMMTRFCSEGKWEKPNYQSCMTNDWDKLLQKKKELEDYAEQCNLSNSGIIEGLRLFMNMTEDIRMFSATELSVIVDVLDTFVFLKDKQESKCPRSNRENTDDNKDFLTNYFQMINLVIAAASNLLDNRNMDAWKYTKPSGFEGRKLLGLMRKFYEQTSANINNFINKFLYTPRQMWSTIQERNIIVKIKAFRWSDFIGSSFPDSDDLQEMSEDWTGLQFRPTVALSQDFLTEDNTKPLSIVPTHVVIITALYRGAESKAVHASRPHQQIERTGTITLLHQKINSEIIDIAVSVDSQIVKKIRPQSLKISFKLKSTHNISKPCCLQLSGDFRQSNLYDHKRIIWNPSCRVPALAVDPAVCVCDQLGVLAMASDMFNDDWQNMKPPNDLIALPSYFGCTVSALLVTVTLIMLVYLRTSSNTSAIHKHFSAAIAASQLCYMIGIDKYNYKVTCFIFALFLHYFVLSCFVWLMNEAFNLYIVITYAAHSHSDNIDGHMWRFYLLGWIMPGIVVAAIAGVNRNDYRATNMCWINQKDLWLFCGPVIVVIAVTILVLIFTAKEQHESSYTKNEKDNKAVINQTKAIWTQIILLPLSWSFAFLVLIMQGIIVKYLFGLFVSLQGLFYVMFYYLLNDEVQKIYSERKRGSSERRHLEPSDDSDQKYSEYNDRDPSDSRFRRSSQRDEEDVASQKQRSFFSNVIENLNIRGKRSVIGEESSDTNNNDNSDYELITTV